MIRILVGALLALFAQFAFAVPASAKWLRGETRHFVIYSSGSAKELERFAAQLERFDSLLQLNFKVDGNRIPTKLTVYMMTRQDEVSRLAGDKSGSVAGFYTPRRAGSIAVVNREGSQSQYDMDATTILFHEYGHHFMFRHLTHAYPAWYVEGFAEFLSTVTFKDDGSWTIGLPANHRAMSLFVARRLSIEKVLTENPENLDNEHRSVFYGRAWLLVHMLTMRPEYKGKMSDYLALIDKGLDQRSAALQAFGDFAALDRALNEYANSKIRYVTSPTPIEAPTSVALTELDPVADQLVMLELVRLRRQINAKSIAQLRALAAANPARADVWFELALSEREHARDQAGKSIAGDQSDKLAEAAVDKALAINPNHARANVFKADIIMTRLAASNDKNPVRWSDARKYLLVANANAVDDPLVLMAWYESFLHQGRTPSKVALDALARAFELAPEVAEIRVAFAFSLANQGYFDLAIRLVEFLAHDPHHSKQGRAALEELQAMKAKARAKTAA